MGSTMSSERKESYSREWHSKLTGQIAQKNLMGNISEMKYSCNCYADLPKNTSLRSLYYIYQANKNMGKWNP